MLVTNNGKSIYLKTYSGDEFIASAPKDDVRVHEIKDLRGGVLCRLFGIQAKVEYVLPLSRSSRLGLVAWKRVMDDPDEIKNALETNGHGTPAMSRSLSAAAFDYIVKLPGRIFSTPGVS